jgi:hypothetical protein
MPGILGSILRLCGRFDGFRAAAPADQVEGEPADEGHVAGAMAATEASSRAPQNFRALRAIPSGTLQFAAQGLQSPCFGAENSLFQFLGNLPATN